MASREPSKQARTRGTGSIDMLPSGKLRGRASARLPDGSRKTVTVNGKTHTEVERKLRKALADLDTGILPTTMTVEQWGVTWAERHYPTITRSTQDHYDTIRKHHITPYLGRVKLQRLDPATISRWLHRLRQDGRQESTVADAYGTLRTMLRAAYRQGLIQADPTDRVDPPRARRPEQPWMTPAQLSTLARHAQTLDARERARVLVALHGLRLGEILALSWDRVDLDAGHVEVAATLQRHPYRHGRGCRCAPGVKPLACPARDGGITLSPPKSDAGNRRVPITPDTAIALRSWRTEQAQQRLRVGSQWQDTHNLVFTGPMGQPADPRADQARWKDTLEAAGLPRMPTHAARRGAISAMAIAGVPVKVAQTVAGHSNVTLTMDVYAKVADDGLGVARDALTQVIG